VRQKSIDKVYSRISKWNKMKHNRNVLTFVSGCVLPLDRDKFLKLFDLVFTMDELPQLPDMVKQYGVMLPVIYSAPSNIKTDLLKPVQKPIHISDNLKPGEKIFDYWKLQPSYISDFEAFIPIQNGCDKFCTYCAVPYTRGREVSRPSGEIMNELRQLVEKGFKSITLLGQNVNSYGLDKHGDELSFSALLKRIGEYGKLSGHDFWVYFTSPHPRDMKEDVLMVMAEYDSLAKQLHLPMQSGDDGILKRMNRKYTFSGYQQIADSFRNILPNATFFTDIIVGFSGETPEQFENTRKAMEINKFNMAYIAVYSPRPGAASAKWEDDIPAQEKKNRLHILTEVLKSHALQYNRNLIGKRLKVLVTGHDRKAEYMSGYTEGRIVVRFTARQPVKPGSFVRLEITSATPYALEGKLVGEFTHIQQQA
jgi:tRNA-2-methylthio-N6-dimethylallyladenosine synthase